MHTMWQTFFSKIISAVLLVFATAFICCGLLTLPGCGAPMEETFWWEDREHKQMPADYQIPAPPTPQALTAEAEKNYKKDLAKQEKRLDKFLARNVVHPPLTPEGTVYSGSVPASPAVSTPTLSTTDTVSTVDTADSVVTNSPPAPPVSTATTASTLSTSESELNLPPKLSDRPIYETTELPPVSAPNLRLGAK